MFRHGWAITLDRVLPSPDMAGSPLQPILATVKRPDEADLASASAIHISFVAEPACPNAEQLADISQVLFLPRLACETTQHFLLLNACNCFFLHLFK